MSKKFQQLASDKILWQLFKVDISDHKMRLLHHFEQSIAVQVWKNSTQLYITLENEDVHLLNFE